MPRPPIVAAGGGVGPKCHGFSLASFNVAALTKASAERIADIYQRWGKGFHPAHLNFGDCFSYDVAQQFGCSLLYVGNDFARTDVQSAL